MIQPQHPDSQGASARDNAEDRRGFFAKFAATVIGGIVTLFPFAAGMVVFLDPLRRKSRDSVFLRVTTLDSVPEDGIARHFPVLADRTDAWNRYANEPIGAVYLRRVEGSSDVRALNAICPHAGCFVEFNLGQGVFQCPCHDSHFEADGARIDPEHCPSPRDLDSLKVDQQKLAQGEVWVEFKNFLVATSEKIKKG